MHGPCTTSALLCSLPSFACVYLQGAHLLGGAGPGQGAALLWRASAAAAAGGSAAPGAARPGGGCCCSRCLARSVCLGLEGWGGEPCGAVGPGGVVQLKQRQQQLRWRRCLHTEVRPRPFRLLSTLYLLSTGVLPGVAGRFNFPPLWPLARCESSPFARALQEYCQERLGDSTARLRLYRFDEIRQLNAAGGCWLILDGMVLDVTRYAVAGQRVCIASAVAPMQPLAGVTGRSGGGAPICQSMPIRRGNAAPASVQMAAGAPRWQQDHPAPVPQPRLQVGLLLLLLMSLPANLMQAAGMLRRRSQGRAVPCCARAALHPALCLPSQPGPAAPRCCLVLTPHCSRFFELYHASRESFIYLRQVAYCCCCCCCSVSMAAVHAPARRHLQCAACPSTHSSGNHISQSHSVSAAVLHGRSGAAGSGAGSRAR